MKLDKVKLIQVNQYPITKPYLREGDFFVDLNTAQYFRCECEYNNKKILLKYQPIIFALVYVDDEDQIILNHNELLICKFKCEMLDDVLDGCGVISTKFKDFSFDISLCEMIILTERGICWLDAEKKIIHLQENQVRVDKKMLQKK